MTQEQFELLLAAIRELKDTVESLKGTSPNGHNSKTIRNVCDEIDSVNTSIDDMKSSIEKLSESIKKSR